MDKSASWLFGPVNFKLVIPFFRSSQYLQSPYFNQLKVKTYGITIKPTI